MLNSAGEALLRQMGVSAHVSKELANSTPLDTLKSYCNHLDNMIYFYEQEKGKQVADRVGFLVGCIRSRRQIPHHVGTPHQNGHQAPPNEGEMIFNEIRKRLGQDIPMELAGWEQGLLFVRSPVKAEISADIDNISAEMGIKVILR